MKRQKAPSISLALVTVAHSGEKGLTIRRIKNPKPHPHPVENTWEQVHENQAALDSQIEALLDIIRAALLEKGYELARTSR